MQPVLIYRNELLPGSETFIQGQANALRRFSPTFIGLRPSKGALPLPSPPVLLSAQDSLTARVRGMLYRLCGFGPRFHARARRAGAALIHAHFAMDGANALPLARALGVPLVVTLHGNDITAHDSRNKKSLRGRIYLARRKSLWRTAPLFLCTSKFVRKRALEVGFPEHKLRVHYIGIDLSYFQQPRSEQPRDRVLFVGRLIEKKGCTHLLRAMAQVQAQFPAARLVVIGNGPERTALEVQARELRLSCEFLGAQPAAVIREQLRSARVFCAPSLTSSTGDSEGLGIVFAEAQAMGVPVVSSEHGGIPEVVCHGSTGFLAPEADADALAQYIGRLWADDALWASFSERGKQWVAERFDLTRQTAQLELLYDQILSRTPLSPARA